MALKRPTPKTLSPDALKQIATASAQQTGQAVREKSYDPNFPVFDIPVNQKLLVYIPNHTVTNADGTVGLRMDKFAAHPVIDGRSFDNIRCSQGIINDELGYDGTCPLCNGISENWELYNYEYPDIAKSKGVDPKSPEAQELLKQDRIDLIRKMTIQKAEVWYTFPIVVIDCEEKDGQLTTTPKKSADGKISGKPMWYSIRERTYLDKWVAGYDSISTDDGEPITHPAGQWAILNFTYQPKSGNADKMGSARALKVTFKTMGDSFKAWAEYFDKQTEEWTPEKAMEVVALDVIRDMNEMNEVADTLLKPVRDKIGMFRIKNAGALPNNAGATPNAVGGTPENLLAGFGATPVETPNLSAEMPNVGV